MTTTVTVRHDGPDGHSDVRIEAIGNCQPQGIHYLTKEGQEFTGYFWTGGVFVVTEVSHEQSRDPERRIFSVDVGDMSQEDATYVIHNIIAKQ